MLIRLAIASLLNRRATVILTLFTIALSVALLLGVEKLRQDAKASFANTISQTDLVVGARSGSIQLLLYSVFRIGNATSNISWDSYQHFANHPRVKWTVPLSLGDSHRGFRVLGTSRDYFQYYRYGRGQPLTFEQGQRFEDLYDAVIGADVARELGYTLGQSMIVAHGLVDIGNSGHKDKPFRVVGILARTGTPVDRTVHVSLAGIEAMHIDWQAGVPIPGRSISAEQARQMDLEPRAITAFMVGLTSKISAFQVQRQINEYRREPMQAILPGVALQELWDLMSVAEQALRAVSILVVVAGLAGMLSTILNTLAERRREMAILRSVGARPLQIFTLFTLEAGLYGLFGTLLGYLVYSLSLLAAADWLLESYGLNLQLGPPGSLEWIILGAVTFAATLVGMIPAYVAYRNTLADGLSVRI
ncbi:ABC transporter permease [Motiliproteus coralliicola]|uniref:ABC transporter permease n=1 Tax=Motiliproteus coralliicola TaxID=2283196 RepID=A0A369WL90_9GAMM|nr:ABC transporter permease [Motiliproteus coralliicola]RDE22472.1 ABC transporter permease [Motiliproteus coralliicola]